MKRHAYLILAHNNFEVTRYLIAALDDSRNDIYIHFDKKIKELPAFTTYQAKLFVLDDRVDIRWGDKSIVEAEYKLFEAAVVRDYGYYHLLSGVDMPLKSQEYIHAFFAKHFGKEFIGFAQYDYAKEVERKMNRIHLFPRSFRAEDENFIYWLKRGVRAAFIKFQEWINYLRNTDISFKKGVQWVSVTHDFVKCLLAHKAEVLAFCRYTFCSDEIYKHTICWNSQFRDKIYHKSDEAIGCMRKIQWDNGRIHIWKEKDYNILMDSDYLFARKFNEDQIAVVERIYHAIT